MEFHLMLLPPYVSIQNPLSAPLKKNFPTPMATTTGLSKVRDRQCGLIKKLEFKLDQYKGRQRDRN